MPTLRVVEHAADCFEIEAKYPDGYRVSMGTYRTRRDANAEMRLIRETF